MFAPLNRRRIKLANVDLPVPPAANNNKEFAEVIVVLNNQAAA